MLNVEQYQYMTGPHNALGLKLLLHHQYDEELVQDFGDNITIGMHTFVAVTENVVSYFCFVILPLR